MPTAFWAHTPGPKRTFKEMPPVSVTVRQLNAYIKSLLEGDSRLACISVSGELSNFKCNFSSGHLYFVLKDESAAIKCVMFRGNASRLRFTPKDGMQVVCRGRISLYERDGAYQLYAEDMYPAGEGDLMAALERIKARLEAEGLFSADRKKPIPKFPKRVAVITSETGAAVRDIINVLGRRYPLCEVALCPAIVQGAAAPESLISALDTVSEKGADLVIIGRGGGSAEDLWCFNDEGLARRIAAMEIPVISAVGHETDFTVCDFVSDLRAPTPSAAAELAVPDIAELKSRIAICRSGITANLEKSLRLRENGLAAIMASPVFARPADTLLTKAALHLDSLATGLDGLMTDRFHIAEKGFLATAARLEAMSPLKTMLRGYAVVEKEGANVRSVGNLNKGDSITLRLADGKAECTVNNKIEE